MMSDLYKYYLVTETSPSSLRVPGIKVSIFKDEDKCIMYIIVPINTFT